MYIYSRIKSCVLVLYVYINIIYYGCEGSIYIIYINVYINIVNIERDINFWRGL